jgi:hypothetical protein
VLLALGGALGTSLALPAPPASAWHGSRGRFCSSTAILQFEACESETADDLLTAKAACLQVLERAERVDCLREAFADAREAGELCREQLDARRDLCGLLGEERYDPDFDPELFEEDFEHPARPNPYFPLEIGNRWEYAVDGEMIRVSVLEATKLIEGVRCIVVNDRVEQEGEVVEDTDDWYGLRKDGTVDYCGEISKSFERFEGDDPGVPELVDIEGSWKAGRDGALAGTRLPGSPAVGDVHRQEWSPGTAEDAAVVLSTTYGFGHDAELDQLVPLRLAELLCAADDCWVTGEFSPLDPGVFERKYYARGIGQFLAVNPETGGVERLVGCNFDARCQHLPEP